jgi:hypothetical protein
LGFGVGEKTVYMGTVKNLKNWKNSKSGGIGNLINYFKLGYQKF